jgi:transglutaminase-like putative cysteine protease/tetratricopeptide (TPR) repeat protein
VQCEPVRRGVSLRSVARVVLVGLLAPGLAGCVQQDHRTTLNPDGSGKYDFEMAYDPQAAVRYGTALGMSPEAARGTIPDPEMMLASILQGSEGVDVWSDARVEVDSAGKVHLRVACYFRDVNTFVLGSPMGGQDTTASPPMTGDLGRPSFRREGSGLWALEFHDTSGTAAAAQRATVPRPPLEPGALEDARMSFSVGLNLLMSLFRDATLRDEYVVSGEILEPGIFERAAPNRARVELRFARMLGALAEAVRDDSTAMRILSPPEPLSMETMRSVLTALEDPGLKEPLERALFGRAVERRVLIRPGKALFDYVAESSRARSAPPPGLAALLARPRPPKPDPTGMTAFANPACNARVDLIPGWEAITDEALHLGAGLSMHRGRSLFGTVSAETLEVAASIEEAAKRTRLGLPSRLQITMQGDERVRIGELEWAHLTTQVTNNAIAFHHEHWIAARGAMRWTLMFWGAMSDSAAIRVEGRQIVESFRILDPEARAMRYIEAMDVDRPVSGYSLKGVASGWAAVVKTENRSSTLSDLEWQQQQAVIAIVPLRFSGPTPDLPAMASGLLATMDFDFPRSGSFQRRPWTSPLGEGLEIVTERTVEGVTYEYLFRVLRIEGAAWMAAGWYDKRSSAAGDVKRVLDALVLRKPTGAGPKPAPEQRAELATVLNAAGLSYYSRNSVAEAFRWFEAALELDPDDPAHLLNTVQALGELGRARDGLAILEPRLGYFPERTEFPLLRSRLQIAAGAPDSAYASFLEALRLGLDDEDELLPWMNAMIAADRATLAIDAAGAWIARHPGARARRWHAQAIGEAGDFDRAIGLLEPLRTEYPDDVQVAVTLAGALNGAQRYAEAGELATASLARHGENREMLVALAWSQMGRKWYREAKATFEKASLLSPGDEEIDRALQLASSLLGQGDNQAFREPIAPVPVPDGLEAVSSDVVPKEFLEGYPAVFLRSSHGHAIETGKPVRTTSRLRIRVLTQEGAANYSTLEFPFRPASQRAYINRIEVKDAAGRIAAADSPYDAYVVSDPNAPASDDRVLHVQVHGVTPGSTIESEVTFEDRVSEPDLEYTRHQLGGFFPALSLNAYVIGDTALVQSRLSSDENVTVARSARSITWTAHPARVERPEPLEIRAEERIPILSLCTTGGTWENVGRKYLAEIEDVMAPDPALAELASRLTRDARTGRDSIAALARWVQQEIRYKAIEFGRRARRPMAPSQVMAQRNGDCKDHALLLHQLLAAARIPSHLALVNSAWRIEPALPTIDQFNHMVVLVPGLGPGWLLDATSKYVRLDALPEPNLFHSHALVLDPRGPRLLPPQERFPEDSYVIRSTRNAAVAGEDWSIDETVTMEGYAAMQLREWLAGADGNERVRRVQGFLDDGGDVQVSSVEVDGFEDLSRNAVLKVAYTVKNAVVRQGDRSSAAIPARFEKQYMAYPFIPARQSPFEIRMPLHFTSQISVRLPEAAGLPGTDSPRKQSGPFCTWNLDSRSEAGALRLQLDFRATTGRHPAERYAATQEAFGAPLAALARRLEW